jgi:hypothetical protein
MLSTLTPLGLRLGASPTSLRVKPYKVNDPLKGSVNLSLVGSSLTYGRYV